jgi:hypothetical protein
MNIDNKATKYFLKNLAPLEAIDLIDSYQIPTPYKEILITACIYDKEGFEGCDFLQEKYKIHMSYWNFVKKLKEALIKFRKSHLYKTNTNFYQK